MAMRVCVGSPGASGSRLCVVLCRSPCAPACGVQVVSEVGRECTCMHARRGRGFKKDEGLVIMAPCVRRAHACSERGHFALNAVPIAHQLRPGFPTAHVLLPDVLAPQSGPTNVVAVHHHHRSSQVSNGFQRRTESSCTTPPACMHGMCMNLQHGLAVLLLHSRCIQAEVAASWGFHHQAGMGTAQGRDSSVLHRGCRARRRCLASCNRLQCAATSISTCASPGCTAGAVSGFVRNPLPFKRPRPVWPCRVGQGRRHAACTCSLPATHGLCCWHGLHRPSSFIPCALVPHHACTQQEARSAWSKQQRHRRGGRPWARAT